MKPLLSVEQPRIKIAGAAPDASDLRALTEIRVQQRLSQPSLCELTFLDPEGMLKEGGTALPGSSLSVALAGFDDPLFVGEITAVEYTYDSGHGREVRVRGYDLLHRLAKRQRVRSHLQVTVADLAREWMADFGVAVQAAGNGPLHQVLIQQNQTDLDFLVRIAEAHGLYLALHDKTLLLTTLEGFGAPLLLELGDTLFEARVEVNADAACRSVSVSGWNTQSAQHYKGRATTSRVGRRVSAGVRPVAGGGDFSVSNMAGGGVQFAESMARADMDRRAAREVVLWGIAQGEPRLRTGGYVQIAGVAEAFCGRYVVTEATHTVDAQGGYITDFSTAPPPLHPAAARPTSLTKGQVTRIDDRTGRVRVSLPTYEDVETDWLEVVCAGAGSSKGMVALPEVGDQVLVLFPQDDPAQGIVLGGLYGTERLPDSAGGRYSVVTSGGQKFWLDDRNKTIRLEIGAGSYLELSPDKFRIHAAADLDLEAPGRAIVIRGKSIDFQEA